LYRQVVQPVVYLCRQHDRYKEACRNRITINHTVLHNNNKTRESMSEAQTAHTMLAIVGAYTDEITPRHLFSTALRCISRYCERTVFWIEYLVEEPDIASFDWNLLRYAKRQRFIVEGT